MPRWRLILTFLALCEARLSRFVWKGPSGSVNRVSSVARTTESKVRAILSRLFNSMDRKLKSVWNCFLDCKWNDDAMKQIWRQREYNFEGKRKEVRILFCKITNSHARDNEIFEFHRKRGNGNGIKFGNEGNGISEMNSFEITNSHVRDRIP